MLFIPTIWLLVVIQLIGCNDLSVSDLPFTLVTETNLINGSSSGNSMDGQAVDIDNDSDIDMIIAMEFQPNVILINDGTGILRDESADRFPNISRDSEDIAISDFDGDGDLDIVFVSEDDQVNEYYQNDGTAHFRDLNELIPVSETTNAVESADFNGDGWPDLLLGNAGQNTLLINNGIGGFIDETSNRLPGNAYTTQDVELGDIDSDGDLDIVEANETLIGYLLMMALVIL